MSATGRGRTRNPDDFYETPAWAVRRFLETFNYPLGRRWLEPGAGTGEIIRASTSYLLERMSLSGISNARMLIEMPRWTAVDLRPRPAGFYPRTHSTWLRGDFLSWKRHGRRFDFAIGNPPYRLAQEFADKCFSLAKMTAFLLRLNFAGSAERQPWFREHPADIYILPDRPSFCIKLTCAACDYERTLPANAVVPRHHARCGGKVTVTRTDATEYAWFVWGDGAGVSRDPKVVWLDRTPRSERGGKG